MKHVSAALLFILIAFVTSLASTAERPARQIKLHIGEQAHVGNLSLEFVAVVQDSRCPVNVQCITAGNAKVQIRIKNDKSGWITVELNTTDQPTSFVHAGNEIRLLEILPKPGEGVSPKQSDYVASFSIGVPSSNPSPRDPVGPPEQS